VQELARVTSTNALEAASWLHPFPHIPGFVWTGCAVTRTYYIGIVEEYWNYVPQGKDVTTGKIFTEDK
jgi:hypothetical protein